ncbi:MAG TPA: hypothetical protein VFO79_08475, partial [Xanthomonadales bacterium]|nr:hypothetical protein [Xanthomonadales bacterium]
MRCWAVLVLVGCHGLPPAPPLVLTEQTVPKPPRAGFSTVPAELADPGAIDRIRHRTRIRWFGRASPIHGETPEPIISRAHKGEDVDEILPVIGESATEIRVVFEDDKARLALWIDRRDTWPTILVPLQLADREGRVHATSGAFLETGAPCDIAFGRDRMRHVTLRDPDLAVDGWVPASAVGHVWLAAPGDKADVDLSFSSFSFTPPADKRPKTMFAERATLRAAGDASAPIVGVVLGKEVLGFVEKRGAWTEVEIPRPFARVRGFVRASELRPATDDLTGFGSGRGGGFARTHTDRIVIPAGTCLYDVADGDVVGVTTAEAERYGERQTETDGWSRVFVNSPWAVFGFF